MRSSSSLVIIVSLLAIQNGGVALAGFLSGDPSSANLQLRHGPTTFYITPAQATNPGIQFSSTGDFKSVKSDLNGSWTIQSGIYAGVEPTVAFIGIANGSSIHLDPPTNWPKGPGYDPNPLWTATSDFIGDMYYVYNTVPNQFTQMYFTLQYSLHGHLAPGAEVLLDLTGRVESHGSTTVYTPAPYPSLHYKSSEGGDISFSDQKVFSFQSFQQSFSGVEHMYFSARLTLQSPSGAGPSWVSLDPGISAGFDPEGSFPWAAPAAAVPEPSTLVMLLGFSSIGAIIGGWRLRRNQLQMRDRSEFE